MQCLKCGTEFDPERYECPVCAANQPGGRLSRWLNRAEDILIEIMLFMMVAMVLAQILLRNLLQTGIPGGDDLIRHLVLWVGFLGAAIATRSSSHVKIDVVSRVLPDFWQKLSKAATNLFSFVVCGILVWASFKFVYIEYQAHGHTQFLNLPIWVMQIILPAGYFIIALRFARNGTQSIRQLLREK